MMRAGRGSFLLLLSFYYSSREYISAEATKSTTSFPSKNDMVNSEWLRKTMRTTNVGGRIFCNANIGERENSSSGATRKTKASETLLLSTR